jgi:probable F420-dependent oxidoreductase
MTSNASVRFGFCLPVRPDEASPRRFAALYELCEVAEDLGYDFVAIPHHRFTPDNAAPSVPLMVLAAIAARTTRLRLSTSVFLMPMHHALEVAEQIATLDQLSDGRANITFGIGYRPYEYEHSGLSFRSRGSRLEEGMEILHQAWTGKTVEFHGQHYDISGASVTPKPAQQPYPPVWIGAQAKAGIDRTARLAEGWLADYMQPVSVVRRRASFYRGRAAELGRPSTVCLMRQVAIAPTRAEIERRWLPEARASFLSYWQAGGRWPGGEVLAERLLNGEEVGLDNFIADRDIAGSPEDCVAQIEGFHRITGCEYFLAAFGDSGGIEQTRAALELFGRDVVPAFA